MTLLKELIDIPERVQRGQFVLKLTEGVNDAEGTLGTYVVTPELVRSYDAALSVIKSAVEGRSSKATYLHGSFGSGKSHFMAVLHLILNGNPQARGVRELADVVHRHNDWMQGKEFLLVPFHLLGAHDLESGVLGEYVKYVRRVHPEAPIPPVYASTAIMEEARQERQSYGDEAFFNRLNEGNNPDSGWGALETQWSAESFERAAASDPASEEHRRLLSALLRTVASSHAEVITNRGGMFVRFDEGLSIMSRHARDLGYDALVLFLDELILWLSQRASDLDYVREQASKITSLVESQSADRPIPIVSFVARQRDLSELVGDHIPGAQRLSFGDALSYQGGRLETITLEDRNLPAIAEKRVLKRLSTSADAEMASAFEESIPARDEVMRVLLTQEGDREMFRQVYPFSPALVQTLVAVSSVLQRERTALQVMTKLLVDQRETLRLGDIVPVGDLFDVVAQSIDAPTQELATHFENARRLYHQKLLPLLERANEIRSEDLEGLPYDDPKRTAFRNDDRLVKTLLLSALAPEVESLRGMTAERLAALNHGTIKTPIPGNEGRVVLGKIRSWIAAGVGEIRISEGQNPTITVQLSGVDTETILENAAREDNPGNRIRRVRRMLFEELGVQGEGQFEQYHEFLWKNTKRTATILFQNIRTLSDTSLQTDDDNWKLVIDYPFDDQGHGPSDDVAKLQNFRSNHADGAKTICWVPSFLNQESLRDLGTLVKLDHILASEDRFNDHANFLSPQDRVTAKSNLESQRNQLTEHIRLCLASAYGISTQGTGVDSSHSLPPNQQFQGLKNGLALETPRAARLEGAMEDLLGQALACEFPAAPEFGAEVRANALKKVLEQTTAAAQTSDGRLAVDTGLRPLLRDIAQPLKLGEMGADATHFVLAYHWKSHFERKEAEHGAELSVRNLREWIDSPRAMGLPKEAQNAIILTFAAHTGRSVFLHNGPYGEATVTNLPDDCELRTVELPDREHWEAATQLADRVFGTATSPHLSAGNVEGLVQAVKTRAQAAQQNCVDYAQALEDYSQRIGLNGSEARLATAQETVSLLDRVLACSEEQLVKLLATTNLSASPAALSDCVGGAENLKTRLAGGPWDNFELLSNLRGEHQEQAVEILKRFKEALSVDEHVTPIGPAIDAAKREASQLLKEAIVVRPPEPDWQESQETDVRGAKQVLDKLQSDLQPGHTVRVTVRWTVNKESTD
ncbi:MAG: phage resistance protein, partial [Planctomycetota bacterium]